MSHLPNLPISKYLRPFTWTLPFLIACSLFSLQPAVAHSQTAIETEILYASVSADDRETLLARLSDKEVRDIVWNLIQTETKNKKFAESICQNRRSAFSRTSAREKPTFESDVLSTQNAHLERRRSILGRFQITLRSQER